MMKKARKMQRNTMFYDRMQQLGYENITEFAKSSKTTLSFETCRRAINDSSRDVRNDYIVALMQALDFTPQEIAEELKKRGDEHLHKLVSDSKKGVVLTDRQMVVLKKMKNDKAFEDLIIAMVEWGKSSK